MEIVAASEIQSEWRGEATRAGKTPRKWLLVGEDESGFRFRIVRSEYQPGEDAFVTPRHRHAFRQIRWSEKGALNFAPNQDVLEGDIAYFPKGTFYGPQRRDNGVGLTLQFGFGLEMLGGKNAAQVYKEVFEKIRSQGRMEDGLFVDVDPRTSQERRRDPYEAVVEEVTGESYRIPKGAYEAPILMHPDAYSYYLATEGVEIKNLGAFYDHPGPNADVRVALVRLSQGGTFSLTSDRAQVAWSTGGLKIQETSYPDLTCIYSPLGEVGELSSEHVAEVYVVEFPRLD